MKNKEYRSVKVGDKFGRWNVIGERFPQTRTTDGCDEWAVPCRCDCGLARPVRVQALFNGHSKSCGCAGDEKQRSLKFIHGEAGVKTRTKLYRVWYAMKQRCQNPNRESFPSYGGRGINVCDEWNKSFVSFRDWANANGYSPVLQLDRRDNDLGYSPENCQWITEHDNHRNMRQNVMITAFGETKCITDWTNDKRCNVQQGTIKYRMEKLGWDTEKAVSHPRMTRK